MPTATQNLPTLRLGNNVTFLPDNKQWQFRFEIESETSNRIYVISQNINKKHWGCSCMAWKRYRKCKHLESIGLPSFEIPYEVNIIK